MITERSNNLLKQRLVPLPNKVELRDGEFFHIKNGCTIQLVIPESLESAENVFQKDFRQYFRMEANLQRENGGAEIAAEGYRLHVSETVCRIEAGDIAGVRNALKTIRQLAETERGVAIFTEYVLIACEIDDAPAVPFRGAHICWFPETPAFEIERQIRMAAYYKYNAIVLEPWGVFPYDSHPDFCWAEKKVPKAEFKRLLSLAKELGLLMIPQINLYGHASWSRVYSAKHAILDLHPEYQSYFEPDGWAWCLTNPNLRPLLTDLVTELYEFFECPPYFHVGCDEAYNAFSCAACRNVDRDAVVADHIKYFRDLFAERGARIMMWHDMLINCNDPHRDFKGYIAHWSDEESHLLEKLPQDVIICDWQYGLPLKEGQTDSDWNTSKYFRDCGFDVVVCPWNHTEGSLSLGRMAAREKLYGYLMTTWHINHGCSFINEYLHGALAAWTRDYQWLKGINYVATADHHIRQINWDMNVTEYVQTGSTQYQISIFNTPEVTA